MLKSLPLFIPLLFIFTTALTFLFFIAAVRKGNNASMSNKVSAGLAVWLFVHAILGVKGFYTITDGFPPRFALLVAPALLAILLLFVTRNGRTFVDSLSLKILTQLHIVRIFVEVILLWLFLYRFVPRIMTFEGRNFDIVAGISAPFIAYLGFVKQKLSNRFMLYWNIIALLLLLNIVVIAILSAPFRFQHFGFEQPNKAVLYFPFVWLPCFIVPVVLFSHLVLIRRLSKALHPNALLR